MANLDKEYSDLLINNYDNKDNFTYYLYDDNLSYSHIYIEYKDSNVIENRNIFIRDSALLEKSIFVFRNEKSKNKRIEELKKYTLNNEEDISFFTYNDYEYAIINKEITDDLYNEYMRKIYKEYLGKKAYSKAYLNENLDITIDKKNYDNIKVLTDNYNEMFAKVLSSNDRKVKLDIMQEINYMALSYTFYGEDNLYSKNSLEDTSSFYNNIYNLRNKLFDDSLRLYFKELNEEKNNAIYEREEHYTPSPYEPLSITFRENKKHELYGTYCDNISSELIEFYIDLVCEDIKLLNNQFDRLSYFEK